MKASDISVLDIPMNKLIGLENSDRAPYVFKVPLRHEVLNHLGQFHAGSIFSLAESTSGQFLLNNFGKRDADIIPVIRRAEVKYSKPGTTDLYSRADLVTSSMKEIEEALDKRGKALVKVRAEVCNEMDEKIMVAIFEWFVTMR